MRVAALARTDEVRPYVLNARHEVEAMNEPTRPGEPDAAQSEIGRGTPPARTPETLPDTDLETHQAPVSRHARHSTAAKPACLNEPAGAFFWAKTRNGPAVPRPWKSCGRRSAEQLSRGECKACQGDRSSNEPLQERGFEGGNVVFGCEVEETCFDVGHAFADIGRHLFKLG